MQQRLPTRLKPGDTIGVCAPSGVFDPALFETGLSHLRGMGFKIELPPGLGEAKGYLAGGDLHRAGIVNALFKSTKIKAILCARGGFGALRVLPHLDFAPLRHAPKFLVGFSDITAILSEGLKQCDFPMIHGPVVTSLARASTRTLDSLFCAMTEPFSDLVLQGGITLRRGRVAGTLKGGNLATLVSMVGTLYSPDFTDSILFLEDTGEPAYKIDRMLTQLCLAGVLAGVRGVVLGTFDRCGDVSKIYDIVTERFDDPMVPILAGLDAGHGEPNLSLPLGVRLILDADRHTLGVAPAGKL